MEDLSRAEARLSHAAELARQVARASSRTDVASVALREVVRATGANGAAWSAPSLIGMSLDVIAVHGAAVAHAPVARAWQHGESAWPTVLLSVDGTNVAVVALSFSDPSAVAEDERAFAATLLDICAHAFVRATEDAVDGPVTRARDELLGLVGHELRTPLNAVLGWAALARTGRLDAEGTARALAIIERNARLQARVVDDLLAIAQIARDQATMLRTAVEIGDLLSLALEGVREAAEVKGVSLQVESETDVVAPVIGDAERLRSALGHVLANAVKFTPKGKSVRVSAASGSSHVVIRVADEGLGIHPEFMPYVFDAFRQHDAGMTRSHGGLGLGLAIARHYVQLHGGSIGAESDGEGRGATFTIRIPVAAADSLSDAT